MIATTTTAEIPALAAAATRPAGTLPMSARTILVGLGTVRAVLGVDAESVLAQVDAGELKWVFNLALGMEKRTLRFYLPELSAPAEVSRLALAEVIARITGAGATIRRGELERRLVVSHVTIGRWIKERHITLAAPGLVSRPSLESFLTTRWLGTLAPGKMGVKP